eukprot:15009447-Ditylum_brightwellii.AAC.1
MEFYTENNQPEKALACKIIHHVMKDPRTGLEKILPHQEVIPKENMETFLMEHHKNISTRSTTHRLHQASYQPCWDTVEIQSLLRNFEMEQQI